MASTRALRFSVWVVSALAILLGIAGVVLAVLEPSAGGDGVPVSIVNVLVYAAFSTLGAIVVLRQSRNPVGWVLVVAGGGLGALNLTDHAYWYSVATTGHVDDVATYAAWFESWAWIPPIAGAFTILPLLFPTGRPLSRRWRPLVWIALGDAALTVAGNALVAGPVEGFPKVVNPVGTGGEAVKIVAQVGFFVLVPVALAAMASLVMRFRRSRGVERQQLKWVAASAVALVASFIGSGLAGDAGYPILLLGLLCVAAAVAIAMLRYRLYDFDLVINRTLVYGALTAILAGVYLGSVLLLQLVLSGMTSGSGLAVAGSTLAVAALFQPARGRVQAAVDRRFYRRKYDAARTIANFGVRLRDEVDLDAVALELRAVAADTMQPAHVSVWLRRREPR
ncbi:MAG: hypothetical protein QOJ89_1138 [bacterium]